MPSVNRPIIPDRIASPEPLVRPRRWTRIGWAAAGAGVLLASAAGKAIATDSGSGGVSWMPAGDLGSDFPSWTPAGDLGADDPSWILVDDRGNRKGKGDEGKGKGDEGKGKSDDRKGKGDDHGSRQSRPAGGQAAKPAAQSNGGQGAKPAAQPNGGQGAKPAAQPNGDHGANKEAARPSRGHDDDNKAAQPNRGRDDDHKAAQPAGQPLNQLVRAGDDKRGRGGDERESTAKTPEQRRVANIPTPLMVVTPTGVVAGQPVERESSDRERTNATTVAAPGTPTSTPTGTPPTATPATTGTPTVVGTPEDQSEKVTVCHATGSSTNPFVLIRVSKNAAETHARLGDRVGAQSEEDCTAVTGTPTIAATPTVTGTPPTATPTATGTPPTATATGTPPTATATGTPPTATATGTPPTATPTITPTPTRTPVTLASTGDSAVLGAQASRGWLTEFLGSLADTLRNLV